jgi:hypothetical protein
MNTMAAVKSAPRWNSDLARALAAYEHEELAMPSSELRARAAGPCRPMTRRICPRDTKACTAPASAKPSTSAHALTIPIGGIGTCRPAAGPASGTGRRPESARLGLWSVRNRMW